MTTATKYNQIGVMQEWENILKQGYKLSPQEATDLAERVGREMCKCEPLERILKNLEKETSSPRTFDGAKIVFTK